MEPWLQSRERVGVRNLPVQGPRQRTHPCLDQAEGDDDDVGGAKQRRAGGTSASRSFHMGTCGSSQAPSLPVSVGTGYLTGGRSCTGSMNVRNHVSRLSHCQTKNEFSAPSSMYSRYVSPTFL